MTERERELVTALSAKIKMLSFEDILQRWWPSSLSAPTNARRRLSELVEERLLAVDAPSGTA